MGAAGFVSSVGSLLSSRSFVVGSRCCQRNVNGRGLVRMSVWSEVSLKLAEVMDEVVPESGVVGLPPLPSQLEKSLATVAFALGVYITVTAIALGVYNAILKTKQNKEFEM